MSAVRLTRVEADKVSKVYGRHRAVAKVSLTLEPGRVVSLLGPNGSGKTTLMMLFSTLSRPSSGAMKFGDLAPDDAREARGSIGLVSHAPLSYPDLTARENVALFARIYRRDDPDAVAAQLLERFDLADAMDRPSRTFSRGMLQRLGLARALVGAPDLVLLDEPFTGLDKRSTERVVAEVDALRNDGRMVLMISHDHGIAAELSDEFVMLRRGKLVRHETSKLSAPELRELYAAVTEERAPAAAEPAS